MPTSRRLAPIAAPMGAANSRMRRSGPLPTARMIQSPIAPNMDFVCERHAFQGDRQHVRVEARHRAEQRFGEALAALRIGGVGELPRAHENNVSLLHQAVDGGKFGIQTLTLRRGLRALLGAVLLRGRTELVQSRPRLLELRSEQGFPVDDLALEDIELLRNLPQVLVRRGFIGDGFLEPIDLAPPLLERGAELGNGLVFDGLGLGFGGVRLGRRLLARRGGRLRRWRRPSCAGD